MNKMLEKNVIGWKEGDYSVLSLQSFFMSQFLPAVKMIKESFGDLVSSKESAVSWYANYAHSTLLYILAKTSSIGYFPVCSELRPMQLSVEDLLQDFATGLSCFTREVEALLSKKENSDLRKYFSAIKEFVEIIPSINVDLK